LPAQINRCAPAWRFIFIRISGVYQPPLKRLCLLSRTLFGNLSILECLAFSFFIFPSSFFLLHLSLSLFSQKTDANAVDTYYKNLLFNALMEHYLQIYNNLL